MNNILTSHNLVFLLLVFILACIIIYFVYPEKIPFLNKKEDFQGNIVSKEIKTGIALAWKDYMENKK